MQPTIGEGAGAWVTQLYSQLSACLSVEDVERTLDTLDPSFLATDNRQAESVIRQMQATRGQGALTELILACGPWSEPLSDWLDRSFPKSPDAYLGSVHSAVLERLSLFLTFVQHPFGRNLDHALLRNGTWVQLAPTVMAGLVSFSLEEQIVSPVEPGENEFDGSIVGMKKRQSQKKQLRKAKRQATELNVRDLQKLGFEEPQTRLEAYTTAQFILEEMRGMLKDYLTLLQHDVLVSTLQKSFLIHTSVDAAEAETPENDQEATEPPPDETQAIPSAYPCVQPMKAALYFESATGFGDWRILISTRADRDLRNARRSDQKFFKIVIKKIIELSNGHFSDDNQKRLTKDDVDFPVFEAKMTRDSRLVYQIDCIPEYDNNFERQVIKIFGVYTHAQIDKRFWNSMGYQLSTRGKTYRDRCKFRNRPHHTGDNVILPASFPPQEHEENNTVVVPELPTEDLEEIHSLLVLEKFVTLSKELLTSIWADLDVAHVFNVTPQEKEIIEHPHSCYVLGRSGTGKTTTMLFKMLGLERAYALRDESVGDAAKPRQVFVTQSRVLASRVEEYFAKLLESLTTAKKSKEEIKRIADHKKQQEEESNLLYDVDDDVTWKAGLPEKFSLLEVEHFPLFLTFERLSQLLEGDSHGYHFKSGHEADKKGRLITYDVFFEQYWPHFPQDLTKNLDPALVFSELLGVIEGSEESLNHESRYLDLASYRSLSHRAQHVFAKQRDRLYSLFTAYLKLKRQHGDYDTADRTHRIIKAFEASGIPGTKIDYLYVDEAQDNLLIDAMLLRSLCRNPNGLFWAGDTAQTIAIGSSFRFNDLKAFLYRLERRREQRLIEDSGVTQSELRTFQLAVNYRSHGGIVRCATAVIELITHFWPYAIDSLAPEKGVVDGAKPVFFSGWDRNTVRYEQFLFGDSGERIEFGARQCILVRDETARAELRQQVGDIGLILTLYESKGLEFDDVLLYKFFEDSKIDLSQWRVVLNLVDRANVDVPVPRFDEERHAGVCSELKFLYVAITRSRKNLWIVDCSEKAEPMKMLWQSKGFIQNCTPGGDVPKLAVSSSPEEWANTGRTLFNNRRYLQAMHAFERADMAREAKIAYTHHLRETARLIPPTNKENLLTRRKAFHDAAESFLVCARGAKGKEQKVYYHNAGDCYEQGGNCSDKVEDYGLAARAYECAKEYNPAVKLYRKSGMFDEAVNIVQHHRHEVEKELADSVLDVARLFYFRNKEFSKAKTLFDSVEEQLEYLEDNVLLDDCHAAVLTELGRYQEAADIHMEEGRPLDAIKVLLEDKGNSESTARANAYILRGLWQNTSFSHKIKDTDTDAIKLLALTSKVEPSLLSPSQQDEIYMFRNLLASSSNLAIFRRLGQNFLKRHENHQALLCLDHYFLNLPSLTNADNNVVSDFLQGFRVYCGLVQRVVASLNLEDEQAQRTFNYQPASGENTYRLRLDTWAFKQATSQQVSILESDEDSVVVTAHDLLQVLKTGLRSRLELRLAAEDELCHYRAPAFTPCFTYVMNSLCRRVNCPEQHIDYKEMNQAWFNTQLRIHLLQILIYQVYHSIPSLKNTIPGRRYWIHKLYETLRPFAHYLGSQASVRLGAIPEAQAALDVMKNWTRDILSTRSLRVDHALLTFVYEAGVLCNLFDGENARQYLSQAPLLWTFAEYPLYHRPIIGSDRTVCIVPELYHCIRGTEPTFISAGILFLQQVIEKRIPIAINVLCHLAEFLSSSVILARVRFRLHNVTLPRGWLLHLLQQITVREAETQFLDRLLDCMRGLLESLINGGDAARHLYIGNRDLADYPGLRELFIARICRALGLVGYNIENWELRNRILSVMRLLNPPVKIHWSFEQFVRPRDWTDVGRAVRLSYTESQLDELVQLCLLEKQNPQQRPPPPGIRRVFFKSLEDLPLVLSTGPMRADAPAFVPRALQKSVEEARAEAGAEAENEAGEGAVEKPEADTTDVVDSRNLVDSFATAETPQPVETISEEQKAIGEKLWAKYQRRVRSRKLERGKSATQKARDSYFETCLKLSEDMEWPYGFFYRKLYLGLVPNLLACVNRVESYAYAARLKAKKRFRSGKDSAEDLEGLNKRMNDLNVTFKMSKSLQKQLEPSSDLHKKRDIEELKKLVREVEELVKRVPQSANLDVQSNLELAIKGIVKQPPPPKSPPKPELNVEDIDGAQYDMHDIYDE